MGKYGKIEGIVSDIERVLRLDVDSIKRILQESGHPMLARMPIKIGLTMAGATRENINAAIGRLMSDLHNLGLNEGNVGAVSQEILLALSEERQIAEGISGQVLELTDPERLKKRGTDSGLRVSILSNETVKRVFNTMVELFINRMKRDGLEMADVDTIAAYLWQRVMVSIQQEAGRAGAGKMRGRGQLGTI